MVSNPAVLARLTRLYGGTQWEEHLIPRGFVVNGKGIFLRWFRPSGSVNDVEYQFIAQCREKKHLPILVIDSNLMPHIAKHIREAQAQGQPSVLTYLGVGHPQRGQNRKSACKPAKMPYSCDEYPFASTAEGGAGASTAIVPFAENAAQGRVLNAFYKKSFNYEAGRQFKVVVK